MYENIRGLRLERRGRILVITIDNPPMNAMTPLMHTELSFIFGEINRDPDTAVVVLTGAGDAFSAGGNINTMAARAEQKDTASMVASLNEAKEIIYGLLRLQKPLIGRINGHAMGLGATLAAFCDISYMVETAKIADTHVKIGIVAGDGGSLMWPLLMGFGRAKEYLMTGDVMTGRQAAELGLINYAVKSQELDERVYGMADRLAAGATIAINGTKTAVNMLLLRQFESLVENHVALELQSFHSEDHREAAVAFRDKREPKFTGK
ncbi:MAG TPA: enoyl-CoA hydratase-related protein [Steroidobacteraceae bacterium]|jgi:enoyl-CoA hydratase